MAETCKSTIQIKRGDSKDLPVLKDGELGFSEDTKELYIGQPSGENLKIYPATTPLIREIRGNGYSSPETAFTNKRQFLPVMTSSFRSNALKHDDYFGTDTVPLASPHPTISIKKSGFYMFQFGLRLSPEKSDVNLVDCLGIEGVYNLSSSSRSFIKIVDPIDVVTSEDTYHVQGTGMVYIDVENSSYNGVPIFLSLGTGVSSQLDEQVLATITGFSFHLSLIQEEEGEVPFRLVSLT